MSWSYSQVLVAEYSAACCSDTELSALLSMTPTPDQFYWPDKTTEHSRLSRFGMTCAPLTGSLGAPLLTWFQEASRARTSALPETEPDWTASGQGYGEKWRGLLAKFDPASCSLKTAQLSLLEDSTACSPTLPRWGLMLDGELYPQPMLALRTSGKESGFWQTPVADDSMNRAKGKWNSRGEPKLSAQVMFPTPNCIGFRSDGELRLWPTATAYKGWSPKHNRAESDDRLDYTVERESFSDGLQTPPMRLNPDWVEWLMGWPIGLTELKPLGTGRFQEFVQQHGICFTESDAAA